MNKKIYLDYAATANHIGNAGSIHERGRDAKAVIDQSRNIVQNFINAEDDTIVFTSGGSESNSLAICGLANCLQIRNKTHIVTSPFEHKSVLNAIKHLVRRYGMTVDYVYPEKNGVVDVNKIADKIQENTGLVSIMGVNNEIGSVQRVEEIGDLCKNNGALFHTDCVQAIDTMHIDVKKMNIDFLSMSGHKINAPFGTGFLYVKDKFLLKPIIHGGGQEFGLRAGTENVHGINKLAEKITLINERAVSYKNLKHFMVSELRKNAEKYGLCIFFNADSETNDSKILSLRIQGVDGQSLVLALSAQGIYVSAGSACNSTSNEVSHVLKAIGLTDEEAHETIRISFGAGQTEQELSYAAQKIISVANIIQKAAII